MTALFIPPCRKVKTKDCPTSKIDKSTQCDPSYFEIVESAYDSTSPTKPITGNSIKMSKRPKLSIHRPEDKLRYLDSFPVEIR